MADPCKQEAPVARLEAKYDGLQRAQIEMAEALKENNDLLRKVAEVLSDIRHLSENGQRNEKAINELFKRVRDLEMEAVTSEDFAKLADRVATLEMLPGKSASKAWWLVYGALAGAAGSLLVGVLMLLIGKVA